MNNDIEGSAGSNPIKAFFEEAVTPDSTDDDCVGKEEFHEAYM